MKLAGLRTEAFGRTFFYFETIGSTNTCLMEKAGELPHGTAVAAGEQTAGKGRQGKQWSSAPGQTLSLSFLLKDDVSGEDLPRIPLLAGLATCRALEALGVSAPMLKWPNDVLLAEKKVAGILCESTGMENPVAVCGIGVNLRQAAGFFEEAGLPNAGSVEMLCGKALSREALAAEILGNFETLWLRYQEEGFGAILGMYTDRLINLGRDVLLQDEGGERAGRCVGVDAGGNLLVERNGEVTAVGSGAVSVRGRNGAYI